VLNLPKLRSMMKRSAGCEIYFGIAIAQQLV
jgi:hypothetical protein